MNILCFFHKNHRKGFTLMETLVTVGIVAILCAIAIPSIITLNRSMNDRHLNNSARAVYLSAQSNLAQMRSSGDLEKLAAMTWEEDGAFRVPENGNANLAGEISLDPDDAEEWIGQLRYTVTETNAFEMILPANILDAQIRDQQILIEYNPVTGHIYAVFYSEGEQELSYSYIGDRTDEAALKEKGIGYYCGGAVTIAPAEVNSTAVTLAADTDGQELIASVTVPVPESYNNQQDKFHEYLSAKLTIRGEMSGAELVIPTDSLSLKKERCIGSPNYIEFTFVLDSLNASYDFSELNDEFGDVAGVKKFIPGENLTIAADVQFDAPEDATILTFDEVVITGVNSLFAEMKENKDASGNVSYEVELSNGRHLQNLNALADSVATNVTSIKLVDDIYWNETAEYYTDAYVTTKAARAAEAVTYELFTPIDTSMFKPEEGDTSVTSFDGKNHRVLYLDIEGTGNVGLFGLCQIDVANLAIVSPIIKGGDYTGTLAGYANGAKFTNCSVYIDTEDEYFSWEKMEEYGVTGETAGGLVGYATNGTFSNCFAAVNVNAAENAGGFVGYSNGADATMCYASGNVTGKTAGGFVGVNDNTEYKQCFASGDVYADAIDGFAGGFMGNLECSYDGYTFGAYFEHCYAAGNVAGEENGDYKASLDGFCGTSNLKLTDDTAEKKPLPYNEFDAENNANNGVGLYKKAYYLSDTITTEQSYYANAASYAQLAGEKTNGVTVLGWENKAKETHSYSLIENGEYPFLVYSENLHYYGEWPEEECPVALAYYEVYKATDTEEKEVGFYISGESDSTLQHDRTVLEDGYVLLCQEQLSVATPVTLEGSDLTDAYKVYDAASIAVEVNDSFYDKITVNIVLETINTEFVLYYNPDFALTQLNPFVDKVGRTSYSAKLPNTTGNIPSKIYIRTARHLAAIAAETNTKYRTEDYNYVQMVDVDFTTYGGTGGTEMKPIAEFKGTYTGNGGYVSQAKIILKDAVTLFGTITGKVSHVDVVADKFADSTEAGFVGINEGEIINCTVGPATGDMTDGLTYGFAKLNSGTIRGSMANTAAATAAAFVGENSGTIADCYAWYPGTTVDGETKIVFVEDDQGEIVSSYAAIYGDPAYVLVYDRDGVAAFRDTLEGARLGENWYYYGNPDGKYPYFIPEGITHHGGWDEFAEYSAFTGYYYYETDASGAITGLYIESVGTTGEVVLNTLGENAPAGTAYGIYTVNPIVQESAYEVAEVALTLNSAPIVPSDLESGDNEETLIEKIEEAFKTKYNAEYDCTMTRELSSQSVYILNGTEINTWFAPVNDDGAYRIRTADQFAAIEEFNWLDFVQETDITITAPLTYFEGSYDGSQKTITNTLNIALDAEDGVEEDVLVDGVKTGTKLVDHVAYGLFANITGENAVIKNCRVVDVKIDIKEEVVEGKTVEITAAIGGLVGENHGTVKTSSVEGLEVTHTAVEATTLAANTAYTADIAVGGLVGHMADGGMYECFATGDIAITADTDATVGGAVGIVDAGEDASVTCMDSYAAVNITASGATVGAFVGHAYDGTFYACHGWNGVNEFIGAGNADALRLIKCYFALLDSENNYLVAYRQEAEDRIISRVQVTYPLADIVKYLNDDRGDIWSTKTTEVDETGKKIGDPHDVKYPVLAGRYDANAVGTSNLYVETVTVKASAPEETEVPTETAEPETTEQPEVTAEPEATPEQSAEPEATETPAETEQPEFTPGPTAEPAPVPTETPVETVTPEATVETETVSEDA